MQNSDVPHAHARDFPRARKQLKQFASPNIFFLFFRRSSKSCARLNAHATGRSRLAPGTPWLFETPVWFSSVSNDLPKGDAFFDGNCASRTPTHPNSRPPFHRISDATNQQNLKTMARRNDDADYSSAPCSCGGMPKSACAGSAEHAATKITSRLQFERVVLKFPGLTVVDWNAQWCKPCQRMAPRFERLASERATWPLAAVEDVHTTDSIEANEPRPASFTEMGNLVIHDTAAQKQSSPPKARSPRESDVQFVSIDVDLEALQGLSAECGVRSLPTFMFFRNGEPVDAVVGADPNRLLAKVNAHTGSYTN